MSLYYICGVLAALFPCALLCAWRLMSRQANVPASAEPDHNPPTTGATWTMETWTLPKPPLTDRLKSLIDISLLLLTMFLMRQDATDGTPQPTASIDLPTVAEGALS